MINKILSEESKVKLEIEVVFVKEDKYYVAYCPALELSSYGYTIKEAKKNFEKEIGIFIEETKKRCSLEKYLLKRGWVLQQVPEMKYEPPRQVISNYLNIIKSSEHYTKENIAIPI